MRAAEAAVRPSGRPSEPALELQVYTALEAAEILRCTASWLEEKARRREVPFTMLGGSYRWTAAHLVTIVQQHEVTPGTEKRPAEPRRRRVEKAPATEHAPTVTPLRARPPQRHRRASGDGCS